jgi:phosphate transport system protein
MNQHIVKSFDNELDRIAGEIDRIGQMALDQIEAALDALMGRDAAAARVVVQADRAIDELERTIADDVLRVLALRQPMARDLREVYAALRISADIERIGDLAKNMAKRSLILDESPRNPAQDSLPRLVSLASELVRDALAAYHERDAEAALRVRNRDIELDRECTRVFRELLTYMAEDNKLISTCVQLMFLAKNMERIGDHATNIAESTWFLVQGEALPTDRAKGE